MTGGHEPPRFSWGDHLPFRRSTFRWEERAVDIWHSEDIDPFLDELLAKDAEDVERVDERLPYWADLWPSALGLAGAVFDAADFFRDRTVCELGCGPGLPGIATALCGARTLWTDYQPRALELAGINARGNGIPSPRCLLMDWRDPPEDTGFDVLLASDVAYEARAFAPLRACFRALLNPGGEVWLTEPLRPVARPFVAELKAEGFAPRKTRLTIPWRGRTVDVLLWRMRPG